MRGPGERGAVTVHAATIGVMLLVAALIITEMAGLIRLRHRVAAAADLAALAATQASVSGEDGCAAARRIAGRNDAKVLTCRMDFDVATITTRATSRTWWGHRWAVEQKARAAPDFYLGSPATEE
ncbi:Rv3654c family TadE-like protein [Aeromicrobium sp. Root236]|uniref:Rv3654c family TadE-like protein n=1 Tax=Aeromicrobium sp. Root236 TaxID=1736498 RepID=UPI0009E67B8B|nr:Rv3654c family TadE-like protein [Aeromicrobium sp. Root236]